MIKDPDAVLDYGFDWSTWLAGDTIVTSTWTADDPALVITNQTHDTTTTTAWLSGGVPGEGYKLTNRITTTAGRIDDRVLTINVRQAR